MAKLRIEMHEMGFDFCCVTCDALDIENWTQCSPCIRAHTELREVILTRNDSLGKLLQAVFYNSSLSEITNPDEKAFQEVAEYRERVISGPKRILTPEEVYSSASWERKENSSKYYKLWREKEYDVREMESKLGQYIPEPEKPRYRGPSYDPELENLPVLSSDQQKDLEAEIARLRKLME